MRIHRRPCHEGLHYRERLRRASRYFLLIPFASVVLSVLVYPLFTDTLDLESSYLSAAALVSVPMCVVLAYACLDVGKVASPVDWGLVRFGMVRGVLSVALYGLFVSMVLVSMGESVADSLPVVVSSLLLFSAVFMIGAVMEAVYPLLGNISIAAVGLVQLLVVLFSDWGNQYVLSCAAMSAYVYESIPEAVPVAVPDLTVSFLVMGSTAAVCSILYWWMQR